MGACRDVHIHRLIIRVSKETNQTHNKRRSLQPGVGRQRRSDDRLRFIYARGSVAGFQ